MKRAVVFIALLVLIVGAVALWRVRPATMNRSAVQRTAPGTGKPTLESGGKRLTLFFLARGDHSFRQENRAIGSRATTTEYAKQAVIELLNGPKSGDLVSIVPREAKLLNLFIDSSGIAYVDFSRGLRDGLPGGAQEELYTIFSIVNTLTSNFAQITRVQILLEGAEILTLAGHVDTRIALPPQYVF